MLKEISSINNEFIKDLNRLKIKKYRDETKRFLVEGYHLIEMAKDYIELILISDKKDININKDIEHILVSKEIINKLSQTENPQGIIGVCKRKENNQIVGNHILILDNVQDPGNVGTLIRSALAFDFNTIIMSNDCVDIYNDKVIRATQGSLFLENIIYDDITSIIKKIKDQEFIVYGTSLKNSCSINDIEFKDIEKIAIILGNEGQGIRTEILDKTDKNIIIPMNKKIESLNVGVAGSIIMEKIFNGKR